MVPILSWSVQTIFSRSRRDPSRSQKPGIRNHIYYVDPRESIMRKLVFLVAVPRNNPWAVQTMRAQMRPSDGMDNMVLCLVVSDMSVDNSNAT